MPVIALRTRKRSAYKARSFQPYRASYGNRQAAIKAARATALQVVQEHSNGFTGMERKFADFELTNTAFSTSWATMEDATAACISATAQGDDESNRDGRVYHIHSLHIRGFVEKLAQEGQVTPLPDQLARIVVVIDTQTNGAQLTATSVMDAGGTDDINSFRNLQNTRRFRVLKDKTFRIPVAQANTNEGAGNLFAVAQIQVPFKWNWTFKTPIKVTCTGTTAVVGSTSDYSIHVIGIDTGAQTLLNYQSRIRFTG